MAIQGPWHSWKELLAVQKRMNQLFDGAIVGAEIGAGETPDSWTPLCDVYDMNNRTVMCIELPGLEQKDIDLRIDGEDLVVSGEREMSTGGVAERFHRVERAYGKFSRRFRLPAKVDREAVDASYRDGVLRIVVPKIESSAAGKQRVEIH